MIYREYLKLKYPVFNLIFRRSIVIYARFMEKHDIFLI